MKKKQTIFLTVCIFLLTVLQTYTYAYGADPSQVSTDVQANKEVQSNNQKPTSTTTTILNSKETAIPIDSNAKAITTELNNNTKVTETPTDINTRVTTDGDRQIYTFATKEGKVFHLIVDEKNLNQKVMLLTEVDEDDLNSFVDKKGVFKDNEEDSISSSNEDVVKGEETEKLEKQLEDSENKNSISYVFLFIVIAVVGAAAYYFKIYKPKQDSLKFDDEEDFDEYYKNYEEEIYDDEDQEDESHNREDY